MADTNARMRLHFAADRPDFRLNVSASLPARGISALFGRSGAGKTTVLRCIAGLEPGISGHFNIGEVVYQDENTFVPAHRRRFGYVFQQPGLFDHLNVAENLRFGERRARKPDGALTMSRVSTLLALGSLLYREPQSLSGGQQQRVAIGRALLSQPRLLLLDEPLAGLDLESRDEILPCLEALHHELSIPIIYVSHVPMEVQRLADYLVLLDRGAVIASGKINELLTRPDLPLSRADDAGALLTATVKRHDDDYRLTELSVPGGQVYVSAQDLDVGATLRVRILARDVSIALERNEGTSISNVLPAQIFAINEDRDPANRLLQLEVGGVVILSRVTLRSVERLKLRPGLRVFAQIKSVALV